VKRCPHDDIRHCPLYVAAHDAGAADYSCDDGELGPMPTGCAVSRGYSYATAVEGLMRVVPDLVKECRTAEAAAASQAQRERNMRALNPGLSSGTVMDRNPLDVRAMFTLFPRPSL
jgi:hypothetical protein